MPETLDFINADEFVAKTFTSTKKIMDKVVIDLTGETSVPVADAIMEVDSIFHPNVGTNKIHKQSSIILSTIYFLSVVR